MFLQQIVQCQLSYVSIMLNKIFLIWCLISLEQTNCANEFLMLRNYKTKLTYCVTSTNTAIAWINKDLLNEIPQQVSNFISKSGKGGKFRYHSTTSNAWLLQKRMYEYDDVGKLWEEYPLIIVNNSDYKLLFSEKVSTNFKVRLSVRAETVDIFICDSPVFSTSNCYSLSLQNENNITKIMKQECPLKDRSCKPTAYSLPYAYISLDYWSRFIVALSKKENKLKLSYLHGDGFYKGVCEFNSSNKFSEVDVMHLFARGESGMSFWKIHQENYLYTTSEQSNLFWDDLTIDNGTVCVWFSALTCRKSCVFELTLKRNNDAIAKSLTNGTTESKRKREYIHYFTLPPSGRYSLSLTTIGNGTNEQFWAVDGIRECETKKHISILQSYKESKCQLMTDGTNIISIENVSLENFEDNCTNDFFKLEDTCVPIHWFFSSEEGGIQICSRYENRTICYCKKGVCAYAIHNLYNIVIAIVVSLITVLVLVIVVICICFRKQCCTRNKTELSEILLKDIRREEITTNEGKANTTIPVNEFMIYVKNCEQNKELERQHKGVFDEYFLRAHQYAKPAGEYFDYIDMIFSKGRTLRKSYIATELLYELLYENTRMSFWNIVWNDNVQCIVLLKGYNTEKSEKYWPENRETMECDDNISVQLIFSKAFKAFYYRKFILTFEDRVKEVEQIQFPYNGLNPKKYIPLFRRMQKLSLMPDKPILVHCSNDIARIGLILLCDMSLRMSEQENVVDVWKNLQELASHHIDLAGNVIQYRFAHSIISEYLSDENIYKDRDEDPEQAYLNF